MRKKVILIAVREELDVESSDNNIVLYTGMGNACESILSKFIEENSENVHNFEFYNIGTCGSPNLPIGTVVDAIASTRDWKILKWTDQSYRRDDIPRVVCVTTNEFASNPTGFGKVGRFVVDMELQVLNEVLERNKLMMKSSVKIVSDNMNGSLKDWSDNLALLRPKLQLEFNRIIR